MTNSKPELLSALLKTNIADNISDEAVLGYTDGTQKDKYGEKVIFIDSELRFKDIKTLVDNNNGILAHIKDTTIHWNKADKRQYEAYMEDLTSHIKDTIIHVSQDDRDRWDQKETEAGAQEKANVVQTNLETHIADIDLHTTKKERDRWNNTYTREEVANMVSNAQSNSVWKQAVNTYDDLATTYPDAEQGWICTVLDTLVTYCYDGTKWVVAFINTMPLATDEINGLLSSTLYTKLCNIEEFANYYVHPDNMNCRHVTDLQIKKWDNKASTEVATIFKSGLMSNVDKEKLDTMERYANYYVHPEFHSADIIEETDQRKFVTQEQIDKWSNPVGIMASETQDGAMSKEMYIKLAEIEEKANNYVHPVKHSSTDIAEDVNHRFVTDVQILYWNNKEESVTAQARADQALQLAKEYTDQTKADILGGADGAFDTLKELQDALGADKNFSTTMLTELSNKVDKVVYNDHVNDFDTHLNTNDRLKLNSVEFNANYYVHPETHPASMIITTPTLRFVTDADIATWNSKAPGDLANSTRDGIMSKEYAAKLDAISETGKVRSDWTQTDEDADSFILHKPESMPANGGNADTIEGYTAEQLKTSNKPYTIIIGCVDSGLSDKSVEFICDGTNDTQIIKLALETLPENGGSILFLEGTYKISESIDISRHNTKIVGSSNTVFKNTTTDVENIIVISGSNCTISDITFDSNGASNTSSMLTITGNMNIISNCLFKNNNNAINIESSNYNKITDNNFNSNTRAIIIQSNNKESFGNMINSNSIVECAKEGIILMSSLDNKVSNTNINNNTIYNCYTGIRITNEYMNANTVNTIIT